MIVWDKKFKTGSDTIDRQHQMLIDHLNQLESLLWDVNPTKETCEFMVVLMGFLESYTKEHFQFEEDCMERHRCPVHARNKQAHGEFIKFFEEFRESYHRQGLKPEVVRTLHQTISAWIEGHMLQVDTHLKPCLKAGARKDVN
jgi:hemerythrin